MSIAVPPVVVQPFGDTAAGGFITLPIPETPPVDPARASFEQGFPPINFQPVVGGGLPPDGRDFNGILYTVSAHCAYIQAGQPYVYNAAVPAQSTGYGLGAVLGMADGSGLWFNLAANNPNNPDVVTLNWIPLYSYGFAFLTGLTGGIVTLNTDQQRRDTIVLQGTLTSNLQVNFPPWLREWRIVNQCIGAFTATVKTAAGTGVVVPSGGYASPVSVYCDGFNLHPVVAPFVLPLSVAPTANTIVQRDPAGFVYATYLNQSSALESSGLTAIFVQGASLDGFLRKVSPAYFGSQLAVSLFAGTVTNAQVPVGAVTQHAAALFNGAALTNAPTTPTAAFGDNSAQVASTQFVQAAKTKTAGIRMSGAGATVTSLNASGVRTGVGNYSIDVTPAGFSALPMPAGNITVVGSNIDQLYVRADSSASIVVQIRFGTTPVDRDFNIVVVGA